jgi:hypothetical protein
MKKRQIIIIGYYSFLGFFVTISYSKVFRRHIHKNHNFAVTSKKLGEHIEAQTLNTHWRNG